MGVNLMEILPEYFRPVLEFRHIMDTDSRELEELEGNIRRVLDNCFIQTCDVQTLEYYEGLLGIARNRNLPAEDRRNLVLARYGMQSFYTFPVLKQILDQAVGPGNYLVSCRPGQYRLEVRVINQDIVLARNVYTMVFFIKPAHLVLLFCLVYRGAAGQDVRSQVAAVRFATAFYPRFNLHRLHLDSAWKLDGSRRLNGYDGEEPGDLYPVSMGLGNGIREEIRAAPQVRQQTGAGAEPWCRVSSAFCTGAGIAPDTEGRVRVPVSAGVDIRPGDITVHNRNLVDGKWRLDGSRKLNGGPELR